ncbi:MAG: hypothetical protein ACREV5_22070 [Steroidobacter sp.]
MRKMNSLGCTATLVVIAAAAMAADSALDAQIDGVGVKTEQPSTEPEARPARVTCLNHCNAASTKCGSEVRRAKQECSRMASTGGRDPMTMRNNDYSYFCGYFGESGLQCGSGFYSRACEARFNQRYGTCIDAMQNNIMSMRHDCFLAERSAQNFCRDELQDCKAACQSD